MSPLPYEPPRLSVEGGIARITLARPAYRNRLHNEDLELLLQYFRRIDVDESIRVVVLGAEVLAQRPVFSAGYNTAEFEEGKASVGFEMVADALEALRPLTVCALNGSIYGGATDFVLACDFAIGMEGIEMRMPAATLGLHYYASGLRRYVTRLGVTVAKRAFLTGLPLDAATLLQVGYLQELVKPSEFDARVNAFATHLTTLAPLAVQMLKQSLNEIARGEFDLEKLRTREVRSTASEDFAEGRRAFSERRAPVWKGR